MIAVEKIVDQAVVDPLSGNAEVGAALQILLVGSVEEKEKLMDRVLEHTVFCHRHHPVRQAA
jgi:hypothetical protein